MVLKLTSGGKTVENAWGLVSGVVWSGDKQRAARTLSFDLAASQADPNLPAVDCPVGAVVSLWDDGGSPLFQGMVVTRTLADNQPTVAVTAMDRGLYLAGNEGTLQVKGETPEAAVRRLCQSYGIPVGELAATGVSVRRKFASVDLWRIVTTLYTLASRQTGRQYLARFEWDQLTVRGHLDLWTWAYGCELQELTGRPYTAQVKESEAARYVRECLEVNPYVTDVRQISVDFSGSTLSLSCAVNTIYGEVNVDVSGL